MVSVNYSNLTGIEDVNDMASVAEYAKGLHTVASEYNMWRLETLGDVLKEG